MTSSDSDVGLENDDAAAPSGRDPRQETVGAVRRSRWPRLAVGFIGVALLAVGWSFLELTRSDDGQSRAGTAVSSNDPIAEYPARMRGEPVEVAGISLTDAPLDVSDMRGQVVVLNVWGSWCVPCREEAPVLARVSREYERRGVQFVGINIKDNRAAAIAFERKYAIPYPSIEDRDGQVLLALSRHVPAQAVPVTLVLDRQGRVAARVIGVVREATLRALLDGTLAEQTA